MESLLILGVDPVPLDVFAKELLADELLGLNRSTLTSLELLDVEEFNGIVCIGLFWGVSSDSEKKFSLLLWVFEFDVTFSSEFEPEPAELTAACK